MPAAPIPQHESERLAALRSCRILDTPPEQRFDDLTLLASRITEAPIALVSLVDKNRQWFKSTVGLDAVETPRDQAFCAYAILMPTSPLIVPDASKDPRFSDNPLVTGAPGIRFYAGTPLLDDQGMALGTLCVIDTAPRTLSSEQLESLAAIGRQVSAQLHLTRLVNALQQQNEEQARNYRQMISYKSQLEDSITELERLSTTDTLTGLCNRRAFNNHLQMELERSVRYEAALALIMVDLDHFKDINDQHGHPVGDQVLASFGELLRADRRNSDILARYGGEEFALILPNTSAEDALALGERLRKHIAEFNWPSGRLTASIGVTSRQPDDTHQTLLSRADSALYAAKAAGRNCVLHQ